MRDAIDAIQVLKEEANVSRLGLIGGRVGGTVAALAADRCEAESLILWEPIVDGRGFVEKLTRAAMVTELSSSSQVKARAGDVGTEVRRGRRTRRPGIPAEQRRVRGVLGLRPSSLDHALHG